MSESASSFLPLNVAIAANRLVLDASTVIALRLMRIAEGGSDAMHEAERMVSEKGPSFARAGAEAADTAMKMMHQPALVMDPVTFSMRVAETWIDSVGSVARSNVNRLTRA
ncbi:hypothetical protein ACRC7T_16530 [Segnochrobactraceae bacterium EtOH-i3]